MIRSLLCSNRGRHAAGTRMDCRLLAGQTTTGCLPRLKISKHLGDHEMRFLTPSPSLPVDPIGSLVTVSLFALSLWQTVCG